MTIKPFKINIPQGDIDDLKERLKNARFPNEITDEGWTRGVPVAYLKKITNYWLNEFDWRKQEKELNKYPQFMAEIDGQPIHFFHIKSKEANAFPLMLLHGWPSSNIEFLKLIEPLTNPVAHGGKAEDAFDLILPTTPGFGLSSPVVGNWDSVTTAKAYSSLMKELGYTRYGVSGGDIGADIAGEVNKIDKNLSAVYCWTDIAAIIWFSTFTGGNPSENPKLSEEEKKEAKAIVEKRAGGDGYLEIQKTRPQTMSYLLTDSPVGQLAWIVEKFKEWTGSGEEMPDKTVEMDQLLTNIGLYWFTKSGASAANFLYDNLRAQRDWGAPSHAPMGMGVFGASSIARPLMDPEKQMEHWSEFKEGCHFPAMEVPSLLAGDLRKFFRTFRG